MNIQEAAIQAAAMKKKLKVFEEIAEVTEAAAAAQGVMDKHNDELKQVKADIVRHKDVLATLKKQVAQAKTELAAQLNAAREQMKAQLEGGEKLLKERTVFLGQQLKQVELDHQAAAQSLEVFRTAIDKEKDGLQAEISGLQAKLAELRESARELAGV